MERLITSLIVSLTVCACMAALGAFFILILEFGGAVAYGLIMFCILWAIAYYKMGE